MAHIEVHADTDPEWLAAQTLNRIDREDVIWAINRRAMRVAGKAAGVVAAGGYRASKFTPVGGGEPFVMWSNVENGRDASGLTAA